MQRRKGLTLIELLVVLAIIAILISLLAAGIQQARLSALKIKSTNNSKNIMLAIHSFAAARGGCLPTIVDVERPDPVDEPPFGAILPHIERSDSVFMSPADPSIPNTDHPSKNIARAGMNYSSYAYNAISFSGRTVKIDSLRDGTGNTIGLGEHYAICGVGRFDYFLTSIARSSGRGARRPSFADAYYGDIIPLTNGDPPSTVGSEVGRTFQAAPSRQKAEAKILQTPHSSGMVVAMMDGGVRTISANVSPQVFWALVTPNAGETISGEW